MKALTGEELRAARAAAAARFEAIAAKFTPVGCIVDRRKSLSGYADVIATAYVVGDDGESRPSAWARRIRAPKPVTRKALYIFLHECAHHALDHVRVDLSTGKVLARVKPKHVSEMEAEKQAHEWMRAEGVAVPRSMTVRARGYVARKIKQALRRGAKTIDPEARKFARGRS